MRSNDPNRRLLNFIYQKMRDENEAKRQQAYRDIQPGLAKADWLIQQILNDLESSRLQADADAQEKEETKQRKILRHQRIRHYVHKRVNDYVHERVNDYVHERAKELWDKYQKDEDFQKRINDYVYDRIKEKWDKYHEGEDFQDLIKESIERIQAALDRACESLKGTAVSETTRSPVTDHPVTDHPVNASWNTEGKYRFYRSRE